MPIIAEVADSTNTYASSVRSAENALDAMIGAGGDETASASKSLLKFSWEFGSHFDFAHRVDFYFYAGAESGVIRRTKWSLELIQGKEVFAVIEDVDLMQLVGWVSEFTKIKRISLGGEESIPFDEKVLERALSRCAGHRLGAILEGLLGRSLTPRGECSAAILKHLVSHFRIVIREMETGSRNCN